MTHISVQPIGICILFHEKLYQTIECIKSFISSGLNIYVLNNNSSHSASAELKSFCSKFPFVHIIDSPLNVGVSAGRNILVQNTQEPWLFFVDNDIRTGTVEWVQIIMHHIEANSETEVFIPRLYNVHEKRYIPHLLMGVENNYIETRIAETPSSNMFPGGAAIVSRHLFNRLGLYDQEMRIGLEDWELALRAILAGAPIKTRSIEDILLIHDHRSAQDEESKKAILVRYNDKTIENSYQRLVEKHKVKWDHDYKPWLNEQLQLMLASPNEKPPSIFVKFKKARYLPTICNLRTTSSKTVDEMTAALVTKILEIYPSISAFNIMGERDPLLCPQISEILDYIKSRGRTVGINTDGVHADKLLRLNYEPEYISLHLHCLDASSTLEHCGLDIFETMIENYLRLKTKYRNVGFSYTLPKSNYQDLSKVLDLCDNLRPTFLYINNYLPRSLSPEQVGKIITTKDTSVINYIEQAIQNRPYIIHRPTVLTFDRPLEDGTSVCKSYNHMITVDAAGNIGGCNGPISPCNCFGNIFTNADPYSSPEMRRLRNLARWRLPPHPECLYCCNKLV